MSKIEKKRPQNRRWMKWIIESEADNSALPYTRQNRQAKKGQTSRDAA